MKEKINPTGALVVDNELMDRAAEHNGKFERCSFPEMPGMN